MQTNINLLHDLPTQTTEKYLSIVFLQLVSIGVIVLLLVIYFVNLWLYSSVKNNLSALTATKIAITTQVDQLKTKVAQTSIVTVTAPAAIQPLSGGFYSYLKKLALYTPSGVWLNSFELKPQEKNFTVSGQATKSFLVLELMKNIVQYKIFDDQHLSNIQLQQNAKEKTISFSLSNTENKKS